MVTDNDDDDVAVGDISEEAVRRLRLHLHRWLGAFPDEESTIVATSSAREVPGWDGVIRPLVGIATPRSTVISVAGRYLEMATKAVDLGGIAELKAQLPMIVGEAGATLGEGVFRYQQAIVAHDARGVWIDPTDELVPDWLRPFNGEVLMAFDAEHRYAAGVGRKRHDEYGQELAVVTEPAHRKMGYARHLVAQAAERVYGEGAVATYLHRPDNLGSAAVAEATGFSDRGWKIISLRVPHG